MILPDWPMRAALRHHLFLAVKEALHNIVQHAGPCQAVLRLRLEEESLVVVVEDNGRGFENGGLPSGNGLTNLAQRLEKAGGSCRIESKPGEGTRVTFISPLTVLRRSSNERQ